MGVTSTCCECGDPRAFQKRQNIAAADQANLLLINEIASEVYRLSLNEVKWHKTQNGLLQERYTLQVLNLIQKRVRAFDTFIKRQN